MRIKKGILTVIISGSLQCLAQTAVPAFDLASVKLFAQDGNRRSPVLTADSLTISGSSLRECIQMAYQMPTPQVIGPDWMNDVRLEIVAKAAGPVEEKQLYPMLQTLLAERLGVRSHIERRVMPVLALTTGKSGVKFSESSTEGPPDAKGIKGVLTIQCFSMSDFAIMLSQQLRTPVVDATGLQGRYDMHLDMTPYMGGGGGAGGDVAASVDPIAMVVTVLQEQLGLKLESRKDGLNVLVVDHAEKTPTAN